MLTKGRYIYMAERRMFAKTIIDSDAFLDMPLSTQALYFHLSMRADDDGFINNPKRVQRMVGGSDDDLRVLVAKRFIIPFDTGVVVIKHWKIHNYIQKDRYRETTYQDEKSMLELSSNNSYTVPDECIQNGYTVDTQDKKVNKANQSIGILGETMDNTSDSKESDCSSNPNEKKPKYSFSLETELWNSLKSLGISPIRGVVPNSERAKMLNARLNQYGKESFAEIIQAVKDSDFLQGKHKGRPWQITFDWVIKPRNYPKVLEGNYKNENQDNANDWGF